jgi:hypothetical protein
MPFYFAYGSNMNPERMAQRGLSVVSARSATLKNAVLCFNKRSRRNPSWACANIGWAPGSRVEGVVYQLADTYQIMKMDPFEGAPRYYSRERFTVETCTGEEIAAWTYVANPAVIDHQVKPLRWYVGQLLAGRDFLSPEYVAWLESVPTHEEDGEGWG